MCTWGSLSPTAFHKHMVCVDKCYHLEFVLEFYIKAISFRGGLLVKSKHCYATAPRTSFYGGISHSTLTTLQNRMLTSSAVTKPAPPPAFSVPVLMTTIAQAPRQNLQVILHTLDPATGFINFIPKWFPQPPSPPLLPWLKSPPQNHCRSPSTGSLACPHTPCRHRPFSSQTNQIMLLSCLTFSRVASRVTHCTWTALSPVYHSPSHSLFSGKTSWGLVPWVGHTVPTPGL